MGDVNHEPTMEEILASIKKIIAEDGDGGDHASARAVPRQDPVDDTDVLELTQPVADGEAPAPEATAEPAHAPQVEEESPLLSDDAAESSRAALAMLSSIASEHDEAQAAAGSEALEKMVREMIRPMLKDWLDEHLPGIVEAMVAREIDRITGKLS